MKVTATYEERVIEKGQALKMITPPGSRVHIIDAMPMGPDVLYKYVVIHQEEQPDEARLRAAREMEA